MYKWTSTIAWPGSCEKVGGLLGVGMSVGKDVGCLLATRVRPVQGMGVHDVRRLAARSSW